MKFRKIFYWPVFSVTLFLILCGTAQSKPEWPIRLKLSFPEGLLIKEVSTLTFSVTPDMNVSDASARVVLPSAIQFIDGETEWNGELKRNETIQLTCRLLFRESGEYKIIGDFRFRDKRGRIYGKSAALYVIVSDEYMEVSERTFRDMKRMRLKKKLEEIRKQDLAPLADREFLMKEIKALSRQEAEETSGIDLHEEKSIQEIESLSQAKSLKVSGTMKYKDKSGNTHPIRKALVEVYDVTDILIPMKIGQGYTDEKGNYSITVSNDEADGVDVWVFVYTEGQAGAVYDDIFGDVYFMDSDVYRNQKKSSLKISLTEDNCEECGAFAVHDSVLQAYLNASAYYKVNMGKVDVYWPADKTYYNFIFNNINLVRGDRWDRDTIMHEYGHYIGDQYGFAEAFASRNTWPPTAHEFVWDLRQHEYDDLNAKELAFVEGWADINSVGLQSFYKEMVSLWKPLEDSPSKANHDPFYRDLDEGSETYYGVENDYETITEIDLDEVPQGEGEYCEGKVTGVLWDILDFGKEDDDTFTANPAAIWEVLTTEKPQTIRDFYNGWIKLYGPLAALNKVFMDNGMGFVVPSVSVTSFQIDNGAAITISKKVILNNSCSRNPTHYMASELRSFQKAKWISYSSTPSFALSKGYGTKTIYFKVKNAEGESSVVSDTITYQAVNTCTSTLTVRIFPPGTGTVTRNPDKSTYCDGEQVTLTAIPSSGHTFSSWDFVMSSNGPTAQIIMSRPGIIVVANFAQSGAVTDPIGDVPKDLIIPIVPDLVFGSAKVNGGIVTLSVRFASGTFDPQTASFEFELNTDQNQLTGDAGFSDYMRGVDYKVEYLESYGAQANIMRLSESEGFVSVGFAPVTFVADGADVSIPLSMLDNDDGRLHFDVTCRAKLPDGRYTLVMDVMPDHGLAPGTSE